MAHKCKRAGREAELSDRTFCLEEKLVDGGASSPGRLPPPPVSAEMLRISGRGNCKEAISSPGTSSPPKKWPRFRRTPRRIRLKLERAAALALPGFLTVREGRSPEILRSFRATAGAGMHFSLQT